MHKNYLTILLFIISSSLIAQNIITLKEDLVSNRKDGLYLISSKSYKKFPVKGSEEKKSIYMYGDGLGVKYFKSLIIDKNKISIQLDKKLVEGYFTSKKNTIAFVFNDTIYQLSKPNKLFINKAIFDVEDLSEYDKSKIVNYFKKLPTFETQHQFKENLEAHNFKKADSLLKNGAYVIKSIYLDAYEYRDTLLIDYFKKINYTQKAERMNEAIKIRDKEFINDYQNFVKDKPKNQDRLDNNFIYASRHSSKEIVALILNYGANKNIKRPVIGFDSPTFINALDYAAINGEIEVFEYLISKGLTGVYPITFIEACQDNNQFMINHLLKSGYNINNQDYEGLSVLHYLLNTAKIDRAIFIISKGIDVNLADKNGNTALHKLASLTYTPLLNSYSYYGVKSNDIEKVARNLIEHGANINLKNKNGNTALDIAKGAEGKIDHYHINTNDELIILLEKHQN
ncbi:ankyrin repeat domain-containing protein [Cellulophaga sp. L1A9]|uniref:ankyrin repeat domain-containing protein n=1 Tax=Cellulophaga sp. L1A9 TaxID=2686362 RepID=UPI00131D1CE4|nr:ankyrin repeat domain-containing protein [Cellulophaga sp. L1A9]